MNTTEVVHAPTVFFPWPLPEAIMIEPTETESKETMDALLVAMEAILGESPGKTPSAPHSTKINRPDEVKAACKPMMRWSATI